jgi:hypothetical protein
LQANSLNLPVAFILSPTSVRGIAGEFVTRKKDYETREGIESDSSLYKMQNCEWDDSHFFTLKGIFMKNMFRNGLLLFCIIMCGLSSSISARAQSRFAVTDTPQITVGQSGVNAPFSVGYLASNYGSITSTSTLDGYTVVGFYDDVRAGKAGGYWRTHLTIGGFSADPGQGFLNSGTANGVTLAGSSATYSYANGQANWVWMNGPVFYGKSTSAPCIFVHGGQGADLNLKFQILGVDYAPPGSKSSTNYNNSTLRGSSTSNSGTWTSGTSNSVSLTTGLSF